MKNSVWTKAIETSADPQRARGFLELLAATSAAASLEKFSLEYARIVAALFSGSLALSNQLIAHLEWLESLAPEVVQFPRRKQGLRNEINAQLKPLLEAGDDAAALACLRQFKQREMLRIAARDLARSAPVPGAATRGVDVAQVNATHAPSGASGLPRLANAPQITQEISDLADVCLDTLWRVCARKITEKYGQPCHQDADGHWQPTVGCVLGLGKLGGQELNYSSDVDVVFVYSEEGSVFKNPGPLLSPSEVSKSARGQSKGRAGKAGGAGATSTPTLTNHQFFNRLAEAFIAEVSRMAPEGVLYRIDLRLRPEGDNGPLTRSMAGYENFYAQWGQTWERMMLIKARTVAGDETLGAEFIEMVQSFRYPRSVNDGVLREVSAMKDRIENEVVKAGELDRNVKLGRGGIREIEFIVQSLQLLHAGRQPFLQGAQTLPCLAKLAQYELLSREESTRLTEAYCFLRDVEHRLQMEDNRQTHSIPVNRPALDRLARLMGFATYEKFDQARQFHTSQVRRTFDRVLRREVSETPATSAFPPKFEGAEAEWKRLLADHAFRDIDKAYRVLREFVEGPGFVHVSPRTAGLARQLLPALFAMCPSASEARTAPTCNLQHSAKNLNPASHPQHSVSSIQQPATCNLQPPACILSDPDRVVTRLDSFISAYGARSTLFELWNSNPAIFELLLRLFDRSEFLAELAIRTPDLVDELVTSGRLRQRKTADETLADLRHGLGDDDQHLWLRRYHQAELMRIGLRDILGLADFEQYLTELSALADACLQYALEVVMRKHQLKKPPFVIIGLGKLGGAEIDYGSDLDIIFVANSKAKDLPRLARMALEVMDLLSSRTEQGLVFHTDARLRPDGEKGLLVNTLKEYETYYRQRAQLWEIQALTRTRSIAGDLKTGEAFQSLATVLTNFRQPNLPLAAFDSDWKQTIRKMRLRIEKERTPKGKDALSIKTGIGGLMDAEFIAQGLCLENGWRKANTLRALERARTAGALPNADHLIDSYRRLRRVEGILRRWSYEGETVLPDDAAAFYRISVRCGFATSDAFRQALADWRRQIRNAYSKW